MEYLANTGRMALDALEPQNKNQRIARYERKRMVLGLMDFAQLVTRSQITDFKWTKIAKLCLKCHRKSFTIRDI